MTLSCTDFNELPNFLLEPPDDTSEYVATCIQCGYDLNVGDEGFIDLNDDSEVFCSEDCCVDYFKDNSVKKITIEKSGGL